ncbi:MAG: hypothetical protein K2P58_15870 [Hyphomonadaceae bacterium]|nr:hypothetical protein [Hyphomonadaceae bacterium]
MRIVHSVLAAAALAASLSACALAGAPASPHDHGRDKTGAPTPSLTAEERARQRCQTMMAETERGPRHDHGRDRTGAPSAPPRQHDADNPTHEQCRALLATEPPR